MKYKVELTSPAKNDIRSIVDYIKEDDTEAASKIQVKLLTSIGSLNNMPNRGANLSLKLAVIVDYKFITCEHYMIVYKVKTDNVVVYRVFDMRRDYQSLI